MRLISTGCLIAAAILCTVYYYNPPVFEPIVVKEKIYGNDEEIRKNHWTPTSGCWVSTGPKNGQYDYIPGSYGKYFADPFECRRVVIGQTPTRSSNSGDAIQVKGFDREAFWILLVVLLLVAVMKIKDD